MSVIGESARKDYLNAYGYNLPNTPFLSNSNGILVDGLVSAGTNTTSSLRLMLTKGENLEPNYNLSFIDLAKSAGFKTYWLSNQGFIGHADTPIANIANRSDKVLFKKLNYESKNTSDFYLLEPFKKILNIKTAQKKLIVIHLYGSHPDACQRVDDFENSFKTNDKKYNYLSCYAASIAKTDEVLKRIFDDLKASNESFSMMYFSDHGQGQRLKKGAYELYHSDKSRAEYEVPLFMVNSNSKDRKTCTAFKSGISFTQGIANWLGIKNSQIDPDQELFNCIDDKEDFGYKEKLSKLQEDRAIDIKSFLEN